MTKLSLRWYKRSGGICFNGSAITYDAWGNLIDSDNTAIGLLNPIRYRGYYYDSETGFYYLQTRYYDPETGRFISPDAYLSTGQGVLGSNMYAYCLNNPIRYADPTGTIVIEVVVVECGLYVAIALVLVAMVFDPDVNATIQNGINDLWKTISDLEIPKEEIFVFDKDKLLTKTKSIENQEIKSAATTEISNIDNDGQQWNYWVAEIVMGIVTPITPLTYSQAREWVAAEKNLVCRDLLAAFAIVKFYPGATWDAPHGSLSEGYLPHYHLNSNHSNHIWYFY